AARLQARVAALCTSKVLSAAQASWLSALLSGLTGRSPSPPLWRLASCWSQGFLSDEARVRIFLGQVRALLSARVLSKAQAHALRGPGNVLLRGVARR